LLNLLGNALKFTDRGEVRLRVAPLPAEAGQGRDVMRLRFEVIDDGIGVAPDQQEAIFRPFEQAGDASRRAGGTGLGLAISRQLVQLMGGLLQVESAPGKGSRFWFDVPLTVVEAPGVRVGSERIATGYIGPRKTILVVDDVATNRALLRDLLGSLGFNTLEAENGMSALIQTQAVRPDMVLLDMLMPGMDGIETTRRLRADASTAHTPVLIISASSTPAEEERSLEVGANAFLAKPINEHDLLREIGAHLKLVWTD
jgi:CheY-like chemotaxis protein